MTTRHQRGDRNLQLFGEDGLGHTGHGTKFAADMLGCVAVTKSTGTRRAGSLSAKGVDHLPRQIHIKNGDIDVWGGEGGVKKAVGAAMLEKGATQRMTA